MGRKSSIEQLPRDLREALDGWLRANRKTQIEIAQTVSAELRARGLGPVSKSAVNRYAVRFAEAGRKLSEAREVSKQLIGRLEEEPEGDVGRLIVELVRTLAFDAAGELLESEGAASARVIHMLARAVKDLEAAAKLGVEREVQVRREFRSQLAGEVAGAARRRGLSKDTVEAIKRDILGVPVE